MDLSLIQNSEMSSSSEEEQENPQVEEEQEIDYGALRAEKIQELCIIIKNFGHKLDDFYKNIKFYELSNEQLDEIKKEIMFCLNSNMTFDWCGTLFQQSLTVLENILCQHTPIKAQGISELGKDKDVLDDVKLLYLQHANLRESKPEYRLAASILNVIVKKHNLNTSSHEAEVNKKLQGILNKNKYKDL